MSPIPEFSKATVARAAELAEPDQVGSFAWHVLGTKGDIRKVQTDAQFVPDIGDFRLTFLMCSCPAAKNTSSRSVACSHVLRVLQTIYSNAVEAADE